MPSQQSNPTCHAPKHHNKRNKRAAKLPVLYLSYNLVWGRRKWKREDQDETSPPAQTPCVRNDPAQNASYQYRKSQHYTTIWKMNTLVDAHDPPSMSEEPEYLTTASTIFYRKSGIDSRIKVVNFRLILCESLSCDGWNNSQQTWRISDESFDHHTLKGNINICTILRRALKVR